MRLPSLNALHAFEAAARHQSFARAAEELHVTQGAVSRHVKLLEEELGVALFRRRPQGIELTPQGRALLPELTASFERIVRATQQVADPGRELRVACQPTLASRWLVRRLAAFRTIRPQTQVTLGLMCDYGDFRLGGYDLGISYHEMERNRPADLESVLLRREMLAPVCAPDLLKGSVPLRGPADLAAHELLHPTRDRADWRFWLATAGMTGIDVRSGQVFQTLEMATSAAVAGLGVAIMDLLLVHEELTSGRLVVPFGPVVTEGTGYYLFAERGRFGEPKIAAFRDWLLAEIKDNGEIARHLPASPSSRAMGLHSPVAG
ncbi:LysR substrate-binding domain-containing protein [Arenibaculum pallidiluteum]|uniref:LysR substrate-binding domain-containing protein n=1 Tax=Arenibaculum pallidiluteum TaxID=2812559 RepID=UPI001A96C6E3|nr:LysR substrate-binding domain-containing protein [Arenibaculum pallidiluteum]